MTNRSYGYNANCGDPNCDKCSDNKKHDDKKHDDKKHDDKKHDDKKGLLTEFDFHEFNQNPNPSPPGPGSFNFLIPLANTDICIDDKCDRVLLNAAINWAPAGTSPPQILNLTEATSFSGIFLGTIRTTFTIWRGNPSNPEGKSVPICSFVDSSPFKTQIRTVDADPTTDGFQPGISFTISFSPVTTDFKCVDENPECGKVEYFLTMQVLDFFENISLTGASAVTFTAMEIEKNDDDCC